jgi:nicotinamidase/pyrazinamidase
VDFILPEGNLYVPGAEKIIPHLKQLTDFAAEKRILVISSTDAHLETDAEFRTYPPHCMVGTEGQKKLPATLISGNYIVPNYPVYLPPDIAQYPQIVVEKQATNVFTNPNLDKLLAKLGKNRRIVLYGVVTEICLGQAASGLIQRGYPVDLVIDAVRSLNEAKGQEIVDYIQRQGGRIATTADVLAGKLLAFAHRVG